MADKKFIDSLISAAESFSRLGEIRDYVSKERFAFTAECRFGIGDEKTVDRLFGLFNSMDRYLYRIGNPDAGVDADIERQIRKAVEIAEAAYNDGCWTDMPSCGNGYRMTHDLRRYFYRIGDDPALRQIDVNFGDAQNIIVFADLLREGGIKFTGVARCLDSITDERSRDREKIPYFDGDLVFVFGDPTDRIFYSWYGNDAGVYMATPGGWRKLLYTPGRGYLDKDGEPDFENETHYSDYKINKSGNGFRFVGNIYGDCSVLVDKKKD